jgi:hypothetical protein
VLRELPDLDAATLVERAVLGDELQQRGDAQGELIGLHLALAALPADVSPLRRALIERKIAAVLDRHHDELYGVLAPYVQRLSRPDVLFPALAVKRWQPGFADTVWLQDTPRSIKIPDAYRALAALPIARYVRRIELGRSNTAAAVAAIDAAPLASMRSLVLGDSTGLPMVPHVELADTGPLEALAARLEELAIMGWGTTLQWPLRSQTLRSLVLTTRETPSVDCELPALEYLALRGAFEIDVGLFDRQPATELVFDGCRLAPSALEALLSRHAGRIRRVTARCWLTDDDLAVVVRHAAAAARLERLDLRNNDFTPAAIAAARDRLPATVRLGREVGSV